MALDKELAHHWCKELATNLSDFRKKPRLAAESKLKFISNQYASLFSLVRVSRGDAILKGVPLALFQTAQTTDATLSAENEQPL